MNMRVMRYDSDSLSELGKLVAPNSKDENLCYRILEQARSGSGFVEYMTSQISSVQETDTLTGELDPAHWLADCNSLYPTAAAYVGNDYVIMSRSAQVFAGLQKRDAATPGVWALINARMIEAGHVKPEWLAIGAGGMVRPGSKDTAAQIEEALSDPGENSQRVRDMARLIFRRFAGGFRARGTRDMYMICPPARAWWICKLTQEAIAALQDELEGIDDPERKLANILLSGANWEKLCEKFVSQLTVTGEENIRNGLFLYLLERSEARRKQAEETDTATNGSVIQTKLLSDVVRRIGQMCSWRALGSLPAPDVRTVIAKEIVPYAELAAQPQKAG